MPHFEKAQISKAKGNFKNSTGIIQLAPTSIQLASTSTQLEAEEDYRAAFLVHVVDNPLVYDSKCNRMKQLIEN